MTIDPTSLGASTGLLASTTQSATAVGAPAASAGGDAISKAFGMGSDDFMKLFLAQLKNQDPTNPVSDKDFLAQLAQMTLIDTMQQVKTALGGSQLAQASSLIGRHVDGYDLDQQPIAGTVDRIVQEGGVLRLVVGDRMMRPEDVLTVMPVDPAAP
jgi:flagellar basal-body rod modification protein FlgD